MTLRVLTIAREEAAEAARWYEEQRTGFGDLFLEELSRVFETVEQHPRASTQVTVAAPDREVRRIVLRRFPYSVVYEVLAEEAVVIAIAHQRRRPNYWIDRLN